MRLFGWREESERHRERVGTRGKKRKEANCGSELFKGENEAYTWPTFIHL
jgi:hypothetical protein